MSRTGMTLNGRTRWLKKGLRTVEHGPGLRVRHRRRPGRPGDLPEAWLAAEGSRHASGASPSRFREPCPASSVLDAMLDDSAALIRKLYPGTSLEIIADPAHCDRPVLETLTGASADYTALDRPGDGSACHGRPGPGRSPASRGRSLGIGSGHEVDPAGRGPTSSGLAQPSSPGSR